MLPVIFQHGLCGDARQTAEVFPQNFPHFTLESRGHGETPPGDAPFSIASFADDVAALIKAPSVVGGISMGAALSLRLAVRRPELVRALILARPAWLCEAAPDNMRPNLEVGKLLVAMPAEEAHATFMKSETAKRLAAEAPDNLASLEGFFTRQPQAVTAALLQSISLDGPGVTEAEVRGLTIPTLVIGTARDAIHPLSHAHALGDMIKHSRLVEITPKAENRARYVEDFRSTLANFLKDVH